MLSRGDSIDRYILLSRLGAGGMGVVWCGYDPDLDRKVAIKLLHTDVREGASSARSRLLREAQALAKLSHPHVITVHDVGVLGGRVWVAMEFVEGVTLAAWLGAAPRSWRDVLEVMTPAARGLAAAHAAGLVHRDIKPDNIMVGDDRRVRVMDFGLARAAADVDPKQWDTRAKPSDDALRLDLTHVGAVMGTPAYMSPEQHLGLPADPRTDQFSWCVTAWEALFGERPFSGDSPAALAVAVTGGHKRAPARGHGVPRWLREVLDRGLAVDPDHRFPSMEGLIAALARGQGRRRRRAVATGIATIAFGVAGAVAWRSAERSRVADACAERAAEIDGVWNPEVGARVRAAFVATGSVVAEDAATRVAPAFDRWAESWRAATLDSCAREQIDVAWASGPASSARACLGDRLATGQVLLELFTDADAAAVLRAVQAAVSLEDSEQCLDATALARDWSHADGEPGSGAGEIRRKLQRSMSLEAMGRYDDGLALAREAAVEAERVGERALLAKALRNVGSLLESTGDYVLAEKELERGYLLAVAVGRDALAVEIAAELVHTIGYRQLRLDDAEHWARLGDMLVQRAGVEDSLVHASLTSALASAKRAHARLDEAIALQEQVLQVREHQLGPYHPQVGATLHNYANCLFQRGDLDEALRLHERALALFETALGPLHPQVAESLNSIAAIHGTRGEVAKAAEAFARVIDVREATFGPDHPEVARALNNLALVRQLEGDFDQALQLHERALAIRRRTVGSLNVDVATSLADMGLLYREKGDLVRAEANLREALGIQRAMLPADHPDIALTLGILASVVRRKGDDAEASELLERALAIEQKAFGPQHERVASTSTVLADLRLSQGRLDEASRWIEQALAVPRAGRTQPDEIGDMHFVAARIVWQLGRDRARAIALAREAVVDYVAAGEGSTADRERVETWLREHEPTVLPRGG